MEFTHESIMVDGSLNTQLFTEGYVHIPFLDADEVEQLKIIYNKYHGNDVINGLYVTAFKHGREIMHEVSAASSEIFSRAMNLNIQNIHKLGGSFIVKAPDPGNILHPHQDWSIVDENYFRSFTIWVPLQDVNEENGCMYVLPGSHNWVRGYRHVTVPSVYGKVYDLAWKHSVPIRMKAGDALIFDQALAHASKPNNSSQIRIAATHGIISKAAEMRIYLNNNGVVEEYACDSEYYLEPEAQTGPYKCRKIKDTDFTPRQLTETEFYKFAGIVNPNKAESKPDSFFMRWFKRIKN